MGVPAETSLGAARAGAPVGGVLTSTALPTAEVADHVFRTAPWGPGKGHS